MRNPGRRFDIVESQAAAWLARRDGGMNAQEEVEFQRWCRADPRHAAAVSEIDAAWQVFDRPVDRGQADALRAQLRAMMRRDRRRMATFAVAGLLAAAACIAVMLWPAPLVTRKPDPSIAAATTARVTSPERQTLSDGSIVELNHGAHITVAFDGQVRRVILDRGEVHVSVTKDPQKPFIVEAGTVEIRAIGTAFAVQLGRTDVAVIVTEGTVSLSPPRAESVRPPGLDGTSPENGSAPLVEVGQRAVVPLAAAPSAPTVAAVSVNEMQELLSWRLSRLDFSETTVADAALLFNQCNAMQLRVGDDAAGAMRVTGIFRSDNINGFVQALEASLGIRSEHRGQEIVLRSAR